MKSSTAVQKRIQWLEFHGQRILFIDFSHAVPDESFRLISEFTKIVDNEPDGSVIMLTDVTGADYDPAIAAQWKAARFERDHKLGRSAVYGLSGLVGIAVQAFQKAAELLGKRKVKVFSTQEAAVRWLTQGENKP